jgi:hypothetical protein
LFVIRQSLLLENPQYMNLSKLPFKPVRRTILLDKLGLKSLSDLGNRYEKWINLGQIFMVLRRIVDLFNEKPGEYGQI